MHNQNNHSFINNGKASSTAVQQMNNMGSMNGMNYNSSARQYHGNHHQQVSTHRLSVFNLLVIIYYHQRNLRWSVDVTDRSYMFNYYLLNFKN